MSSIELNSPQPPQYRVHSANNPATANVAKMPGNNAPHLVQPLGAPCDVENIAPQPLRNNNPPAGVAKLPARQFTNWRRIRNFLHTPHVVLLSLSAIFMDLVISMIIYKQFADPEFVCSRHTPYLANILNIFRPTVMIALFTFLMGEMLHRLNDNQVFYINKHVNNLFSTSFGLAFGMLLGCMYHSKFECNN